MKRLRREALALAALLAVLLALAFMKSAPSPSTYSTFDRGPNGFLALYDVLARSGVPVRRLEVPLAQRPADVRAIAATPAQPPVFGTALPIAYPANDVKRLQQFLSHGGTVVAFGTIPGLKKSRRLLVFDASRYTNAALDAHPRNIVALYDAVAGLGPLAFDERIHGFDRSRSLWDVLPVPVRAACWIALAALVLWLIDSNLRFAPAIAVEPPAERNSSDYVRSMARLLRRARAGRAAIERFASLLPQDERLAALATQARPSNDAVLAAAIRFSSQRKERHDR